MASEERAQLGHVAHHDVHAFGQFGDSFQQFLNQTNESQHKGLLQDVYMGFVTAGLRTLLLKESSTIQVGGRPGGGEGYSLYSYDRDDSRIFRGCNRRFSIF